MSSRKMNPRCRSRRGAIVVLAAILMVIMFGVIAFALDLGYIALVRTQLQTAADASALAAAGTMTGNTAEMKAAGQSIASLNKAAGRPVQLSANDIEPGTWDTTTRTFTPSSGLSNAVRVTVRTSQNTGGEDAAVLRACFQHEFHRSECVGHPRRPTHAIFASSWTCRVR